MTRRDRGVTLVEVTLAILLLAAFVGWAAPSLRRGVRRFEEERAVDLVLAAAADARRIAVDRGTTCRLDLEAEGDRFRLVCWDAVNGTYVDAGARARVLPTGLRAEGPVAGALFFPDGSADAGEWRCLRGGETVGRVSVDSFLGESRAI